MSAHSPLLSHYRVHSYTDRYYKCGSTAGTRGSQEDPAIKERPSTLRKGGVGWAMTSKGILDEVQEREKAAKKAEMAKATRAKRPAPEPGPITPVPVRVHPRVRSQFVDTPTRILRPATRSFPRLNYSLPPPTELQDDSDLESLPHICCFFRLGIAHRIPEEPPSWVLQEDMLLQISNSTPSSSPAFANRLLQSVLLLWFLWDLVHVFGVW